MSGDLQRIGRNDRRQSVIALGKFGVLLFCLWNLAVFVRNDFWTMSTPQIISLLVVLLVSAPVVSLWHRERGSVVPQAQRGVFLDGDEVVVRNVSSEARMPLADAIVQHTKSEIGSEEFIDGEHQAWEHDLRIVDPNYPVSPCMKVDISGMTGGSVRRYAEQLDSDLDDARWRYRLPRPGPQDVLE